MSAATEGSIAVKVLTGRTAPSLQRYRDSLDDGKEPPLYSTIRHCSHDVAIQIAEWKAVREKHGTQGARRTARARHESVDPDTGMHASGQMGTHIRYFDGKRPRMRLSRDGETPTHLRIAAGDLVVKESEAVHTIYAAGPDLVNPDSVEDIERFWHAVNGHRDKQFPGLQESRWLERNGKSGLVHVHVASNATIYEAFSIDGTDYAAGKKMAGVLTRVHSVRAGFEQYLDAHPEHGMRQALARVGTPEYDAAQQRDGQSSYWDRIRSGESTQDRIRRNVEETLHLPHVVDRVSFVAELKTRGIDVIETGLRRGKPGKNRDLAYRIAGAKQAVRGGTLGTDFTHAEVLRQLERKAQGLEIEPMADQQQVGPAKPLSYEQRPLSADELRSLKELRADVEALAAPDRADQINERPAPAKQAPRAHMSPQDQLKAWRSSGEFDAEVEIERQRADREAATPAESAEVLEASDAAVARPERRRRFVFAAPTDSPTPPPPFRSQLRGLSGTTTSSQARLEGLIALDERWYAQMPSTAEERAAFEQQVTEIGIGRRTLDSKAGAALQPALRDLLELRERGKTVARDEIERAKLSGGEDHDAHMERATRARDLLRRGEYGQAAAQSSQRPGSMQSNSGFGQHVEAPPALTPPAQQDRRRPPHRRTYAPPDLETDESQGIEF